MTKLKTTRSALRTLDNARLSAVTGGSPVDHTIDVPVYLPPPPELIKR